jgi:Fe-S cluster assembly iron-binding protein IscA
MMINITRKAADVLKAATAAEGAAAGAGISIRRSVVANEAKSVVAFAITDNPASGDQEFELEGLRFFVEDSLVEPLDGRTLDASDSGQRLELFWR